MANAKKTQKQYFEEIIALATESGRTDLADFAKSRIEALAKKSSGKKPTKTQEENEGIKEVILSALPADKGITVTELQELDPTLGDLSNQRVSALLRQLVEVGKVSKTVDKKKSYFSRVAEA